MKKILLFITCLIVAACSSEESPEDVGNSKKDIRIAKIEYTGSDILGNGIVYNHGKRSCYYFYNEDNLVTKTIDSIKANGAILVEETIYSYKDGFLIKSKNNKGEELFTYNKGVLVQFENDNYIETYTRNNIGKITSVLQKTKINDKISVKNYRYNSDGNVFSFSSTINNSTSEFEYDSKKNPYLLLPQIMDRNSMSFNQNNPIKYTNVPSDDVEFTYDYKYNNLDYPARIVTVHRRQTGVITESIARFTYQ